MEEVCRNCEYFVRMSMSLSTHLWGDCRKPASGTQQINGNKEAVFKWADATCSDFKLAQGAQQDRPPTGP